MQGQYRPEWEKWDFSGRKCRAGTAWEGKSGIRGVERAGILPPGMEKWNPGGRKRPTLLLETRKHDLFPEKIIPPIYRGDKVFV